MVGITAHWVDHHFVLHDALLSFQHLTGSHSGINLAEAIYITLDEFNIVEKLFCITTDNASNNTTALEHLQEIMLQRKGVTWIAKQHHIRCMNHIINICVQKFLHTVKVLDGTQVIEDADLVVNEDDADAITIDEEEEREAAARIRGGPEYERDVMAAATLFKETMSKLRETAKVRFCNTHKPLFSATLSQLCVTFGTIADHRLLRRVHPNKRSGKPHAIW